MGGGMSYDPEIDDLVDAISQGLAINDDEGEQEDKEIQEVAKLIQKASKIIVLSGAGVSVAAGIPDFRTPGTGLYDNLSKYNLPYPEAVFDLSYYRNNPQPFCTLAKELWPGISHSPTKTHTFLKLLSKNQKLLRTYTQNIDGLEHIAGLPDSEIVECHGHFRTASCTRCGKPVKDWEHVKQTILDGNIPKCTYCKSGNVKPDIVFFGESLPDRFHKLIKRDRNDTDLLIVMGTSLQVAPVSMIPNMVSCNHRILINREQVMNLRSSGRTKKDYFLQGDCDSTIEKLCEVLGWKEQLSAENMKTKIDNGNGSNGDQEEEKNG